MKILRRLISSTTDMLDNEIVVEDTQPEAFEKFLKYIYLGKKVDIDQSVQVLDFKGLIFDSFELSIFPFIKFNNKSIILLRFTNNITVASSTNFVHSMLHQEFSYV